jgi:hypothetical protein
MAAHIAGTSVKPKGKTGVVGWGLLAAGLAVGLVPFVGPGLGHIIDRNRIGMEARAEKKALAQWFAPQIAAQLGISPDQVGYRELEQAAQTNPTFAAIVNKVKTQQDRDNRASLVTAAVATPFAMPGANLVAKAAELPVTLGAGVAASMIGKNHLMVDDVATKINEKRVNGQPVTAEDVFMLNIAHDTAAQDQISKMNGKPLHKMPEAQQAAVMRSMPDMFAVAEKKAYALNSGLISEQDLVVQSGEEVNGGGGFASRVGGPKVAQGSYVAGVNAERTAPQQVAQAI